MHHPPAQHLCYQVPHGSIFLGSVSLWKVVQGLGVRCRQYAVNTQHFAFYSSNSSWAVDVLNRCLNSVKDWMRANKLKLYPSETKFSHPPAHPHVSMHDLFHCGSSNGGQFPSFSLNLFPHQFNYTYDLSSSVLSLVSTTDADMPKKGTWCNLWWWGGGTTQSDSLHEVSENIYTYLLVGYSISNGSPWTYATDFGGICLRKGARRF